MKSRNLSLVELGEKLDQYLGLPALIVGFIADGLALIAVFGVQDSLETVVFYLGGVMQLTIWGAAVITYFGILRRIWQEERDKNKRPSSRTFRHFLEGVIFQFEYPFLLIPFVFLVGFYIIILSNHVWVTLAVTVPSLLVIGTLADKAAAQFKQDEERRAKQKADIEARRLAAKHYPECSQYIDKWLTQFGYITNYDLSERFIIKTSVSKYVMARYRIDHKAHRLIFQPETVTISEKLHKEQSKQQSFSETYLSLIQFGTPRLTFWVLALPHLRESKPWLDGEDRYFRLNVIEE